MQNPSQDQETNQLNQTAKWFPVLTSNLNDTFSAVHAQFLTFTIGASPYGIIVSAISSPGNLEQRPGVTRA